MVKKDEYIPDRGDLVWLSFAPQTGHEQSGRRPVLVISPKIYNSKTHLALFCPVTSQIKGYPFEIELPDNFEISGAILSDQIKNLDWQARQAEFICRLPQTQLTETLNKISALLNPEAL